MTQVRLTRGALDDIRRVLRCSEAEFGVAARTRYRILLDQALRDLAEDQGRIGVKSITDVRPGYFVYHLKWSKARVGGASVGRPRHLLVFSVDATGDVIIAAVAHEREMLERHLNP
ncbi:type II toxin-antitoxin system RelE/ParE family toxin [uncultured Thiodictyon sp.]|uniref:type II toxin-antitoxin system RelE/ParE family toxin n=1 Tax=uncultured Thiodictyon sp. TaxID=1846217 RepID=UPI0025DFE2A5|nr:type II toxin-antitoxin system RelE/ParE family toxin [uncultured Thiodictyon sp.]